MRGADRRRLDLEGATLRCPLMKWCCLDASELVRLDDATISHLDLTDCRLAGLRAQLLTSFRRQRASKRRGRLAYPLPHILRQRIKPAHERLRG
jgi:hypothetical protein